ncbi:MAG: hypothetical protein RSB76_00360 [Clostridia bacterium]
MWHNYFFQLQKKYNMRLSTKEPLVIRFDGKDVTKSVDFNLLYNNKGSFIDILDKTVWYFTQKYHCYSIYGSDEVSFIFQEPMNLIADLDVDKCNFSNEVIALFSQYFFDYFNTLYKVKKVFWHGKCFSIPSGKLESYIKYRTGVIKNVMVMYFLKRKDIKGSKTKLSKKQEECRKYADYISCLDRENGVLYYDGQRLDIDEFLKGNIQKIESKEDEIINTTINDYDIEIDGF